MPFIYMASIDRSPEPGLVYIGQARNFRVRMHQHLVDLNGGTHCNATLQEAFDRYGEDAFDWRVIDEQPIERLDLAEAYWIGKAVQELGRARVANISRVNVPPPRRPASDEEGLEEVRRLLASGVGRVKAIEKVFNVKKGREYQRLVGLL
jgi:hypothetical protein